MPEQKSLNIEISDQPINAGRKSSLPSNLVKVVNNTTNPLISPSDSAIFSVQEKEGNENEDISSYTPIMATDLSFVTKNLYIGSVENANDSDEISDLKIQLIINTAPENKINEEIIFEKYGNSTEKKIVEKVKLVNVSWEDDIDQEILGSLEKYVDLASKR